MRKIIIIIINNNKSYIFLQTRFYKICLLLVIFLDFYYTYITICIYIMDFYFLYYLLLYVYILYILYIKYFLDKILRIITNYLVTSKFM